MKVNYIIVGLGLAGISFVEKLIENKKSFLVFNDNSQQSSLVAGGIYNPVILKRYTRAWGANSQLKLAIPFYNKLENKLKIKLNTKITTIKIFNSIANQNNWFAAADKPILSKYMKSEIFKNKINGVISNFGYGELKGTGWINTNKLISSYNYYLNKKNNIVQERFDYNLLKINKNTLNYKNINPEKIVFCEGYGIKKNIFFDFLPLNGTKGETIIIYSPSLKLNIQIKSSVFILPLGNNLYRVGATFNWNDKTSKPTYEGKIELTTKLKKIIISPYKIISQTAGIRPTVKDRRPLVGKHPKYKNLYILNGLGTRGVMIGPSMAENLYNYIEKNKELESEINITRF